METEIRIGPKGERRILEKGEYDCIVALDDKTRQHVVAFTPSDKNDQFTCFDKVALMGLRLHESVTLEQARELVHMLNYYGVSLDVGYQPTSPKPPKSKPTSCEVLRIRAA